MEKNKLLEILATAAVPHLRVEVTRMNGLTYYGDIKNLTKKFITLQGITMQYADKRIRIAIDDIKSIKAW